MCCFLENVQTHPQINSDAKRYAELRLETTRKVEGKLFKYENSQGDENKAMAKTYDIQRNPRNWGRNKTRQKNPGNEDQ